MMPMRDAQGVVIGLVKVLRDQSKQRAAQQELEQNRSELIAALASNEEARASLESADAAKDQFLAVLSHELRNPLTSITAASEMLAPERLSSPEAARAAQIIQRQAATMKVLLGDLLDVSSLGLGKLTLRLENVVARTIAEAAIEATRPMIARGRHALAVDIDAGDVSVQGDPIRLTQVLSNLLANAAKYTPPQGRIALAIRREGASVVFEVSDNGIGMAPDTVGAMFGMFTQAAPSDDRSAGGLGIGLALVRNIVELHGGQVQGDSAGLGQGSRFTVRLPASGVAASAPAPVPAPALAPVQPPGPAAPMRLLLADDNEDALWSMSRMLSMAGYDVQTAANGHEALQLAETFRPDAVVLDIGMPGLDGYAVARGIRASDWGRAMYLVAATGWGQLDDKQAAVQAGFDHHLVKPVSASDVQRVLDAWRAHSADPAPPR